MSRKRPHLKTHTPIANSNWSHQLHFSVHTAEILEALLEKTPQTEVHTETLNSLENLIRRELVHTFVHKKDHNIATKDFNLSSKIWREMVYTNKIFVILYQDYKKKLSETQASKIYNMIEKFTYFKELEKDALPPRLLQDGDSQTQSLSDILATIRRIKKQRKLFSAIKTKKIHLNSFIY